MRPIQSFWYNFVIWNFIFFTLYLFVGTQIWSSWCHKISGMKIDPDQRLKWRIFYLTLHVFRFSLGLVLYIDLKNVLPNFQLFKNVGLGILSKLRAVPARNNLIEMLLVFSHSKDFKFICLLIAVNLLKCVVFYPYHAHTLPFENTFYMSCR